MGKIPHFIVSRQCRFWLIFKKTLTIPNLPMEDSRERFTALKHSYFLFRLGLCWLTNLK